MTKSENESPHVFISYSWASQDWVIDLAKRLTADSIHVHLDVWDVSGGQDLHVFMEKMVKDPAITKVLVICDHDYASKADKRKGGVGKESQIMSQEIYESVEQRKFIPIIRENTDEGKPCKPVFLQSRLHFDFSTIERYNSNYEALVRDVYGKPKHVRPALGVPPGFLSENKIETTTGKKQRELLGAISQDRHNVGILISEYFAEFGNALLGLAITRDEDGMRTEELVYERIRQTIPYRNEFIELIDQICKLSKSPNSYTSSILDLFQVLSSYEDYTPPGINYSIEAWNDIFTVFTHELFLYLIALLIKYDQMQMISQLTKETYSIERRRGTIYETFEIFRSYARSLDVRQERLKTRLTSPTGNLFKERATMPIVSFDEVMQADFVLLIMSLLETKINSIWFPVTLVYSSRGRAFKLFRDATLKRKFGRVKTLLGVKDKADLLSKYSAGCEKLSIPKGMLRVNDWDSMQISSLGNFDALDSVQ